MITLGADHGGFELKEAIKKLKVIKSYNMHSFLSIILKSLPKYILKQLYSFEWPFFVLLPMYS